MNVEIGGTRVSKKFKIQKGKLVYSTIATMGLLAGGVLAEADTTQPEELENDNLQEGTVTTEEATADMQDSSVSVTEAAETLRQVAGDISLKHPNATADSELGQSLEETYDMLDSSDVTAEKASQQIDGLYQAESNHTSSQETAGQPEDSTSSGKEMETTESTEDNINVSDSQTTESDNSVPGTSREDLQDALTNAKELSTMTGNYSEKSLAVLVGAIKEVEKQLASNQLTDAEAQDAMAKIMKAQEGLRVDSTELTDLMASVEKNLLAQGMIDKPEFKEIADLLKKAENMLANEDMTQADIDQLTVKLTKSSYDLTMTSDKLSDYMDTVSADYDSKYYTSLSYKKLNDAMASVKQVLGNKDATQAELAHAYKVLNDAVAQLIELKSNDDLKAKLDEIGELDKTNYTTKSYDNYLIALNQAKKVVDSNNSSIDTSSNAYSRLMKTIDELVSKEDMDRLLKESMAESKTILNNQAKNNIYTNKTIQQLSDILKSAEAVDFNQVSADRLVEINNQLKQSIDNLIRTADLKGLEALINEGNQIVELGKGNFTTDSWNDLTKDLSHAKAILSNSKSSADEISVAYHNLNLSIKGMVDKEYLLKELDNQLYIATGYGKDGAEYVKETWEHFQNAVIKGKSVDRKSITPDALSVIVSELRQSILTLKLGNDEAVKELQKELEKLMTLGEKSNYTDISWNQLQLIIGKAEELVNSPNEVGTQTIIDLTDSLSRAIDDLTFSDTKRAQLKTTILKEIALFDGLTGEDKIKIISGYEDYARAIELARVTLNNLNVSEAELTKALTAITIAKDNVTQDEGGKTILINTTTNLSKDTGYKDGKLKVEANVKDLTLQFFTYRPSFETQIKLPKNLRPMFEDGTWKNYVKLAYNNTASSGVLSTNVISGNNKEGIIGRWNPYLNLLNLTDDKLLQDIAVTYKLIDGQPVLFLTTNQMRPGTGLVPATGFDLNYYLVVDIEQYLKDGHALPIQEATDDTTIKASSRVLQDGILGTINLPSTKKDTNMMGMNELDVQDIVTSVDVQTHIVDGTNTIVGKAVQSNNKIINGDKYQAVIELNGKEIGRSDLDSKGNFVFNYTLVDSKTGNVIGQPFKNGDNVKITIARVNEQFDLETSSESLNLNVVKGKAPSVEVNTIQQNSKVISGQITTLTTQDGKSYPIDPSDKNIYTVRLVYYAPGTNKGIELAEVRTDKYGRFTYHSSMPLQFGGKIEAQAFVYQGIVNGQGDLTSSGIQLSNTDSNPTVQNVVWTIGKPSVNQLKEGDTLIVGQAPMNDVSFNDAKYKVLVTVGNKVYEGDIDETGNFSVKVPKLEKEQSVTVSVEGFVNGSEKSASSSGSVDVTVVSSSDANSLWELNKPNINPVNIGSSILTGNVLLDNNKNRKYELVVTINGVETKINEDALSMESGNIFIDLNQKVKQGDKISVTLIGSEVGYPGSKTIVTDVELADEISFNDWQINSPIFTDPQIGDKQVEGFVTIDSSLGREYFAQIMINGKRVTTEKLDRFGRFNAKLDKALEAYDDVSVIIIGQQGDIGKKQSVERIKRVPESNINVNRNGLESSIDIAEMYSNDNKHYTDESFKHLEDALKSAKLVFDDAAATQKQVNASRDSLNMAIRGLTTIDSVKPTKVTLDTLDALIKKAESLSPTNYSSSTYKVLSEAIENGKASMVDTTLTQSDVEAVINELYHAIEKLEAPNLNDPSAVDVKRLEELILKAKEFKGSDYTQYSFAVLQEAIRKGDDAIANPTSALLNKAYRSISEAMNHLVPVIPVGEEGRQ